jgi:hypothetical protein
MDPGIKSRDDTEKVAQCLSPNTGMTRMGETIPG